MTDRTKLAEELEADIDRQVRLFGLAGEATSVFPIKVSEWRTIIAALRGNDQGESAERDRPVALDTPRSNGIQQSDSHHIAAGPVARSA